MKLKQPESTSNRSVLPIKVEHKFKVDLERKAKYRVVSTNIMVRAWDEELKRVVSTDIAYLDRQSLKLWLSEDTDRTIKTVLVILGHSLEP